MYSRLSPVHFEVYFHDAWPWGMRVNAGTTQAAAHAQVQVQVVSGRIAGSPVSLISKEARPLSAQNTPRMTVLSALWDAHYTTRSFM